MVLTKRIICLANSRKLSGRCVAGIELDEKDRALGWIRPVSDRPHEEVSEEERRYQDGTDSRVLDIIDVPVIRAAPCTYQQENWLLDPGYYWSRVSYCPWDRLSTLLPAPAPLWDSGFSTYHGNNDRLPLGVAHKLSSSLRLIRVSSLTLKVFAPGAHFGEGKRRVQGSFNHASQRYGMWVTDPYVERRYLAMEDGRYEFGTCFLTVSLGEPHQDWVYKMIAAVVPARS